ncbi:MAG: nickel pincer cofactor biosynthesis protein LarC [Clostridia bacterium]|nr:nickel pincer cofactor biosynthesis protein LarC [Clostridia bacterium]
MKTLFIDCGMGAAGDMLCAALLELSEDREKTLADLNDLQIPHVRFTAEPVEKCGIFGTKLHVLAADAEEAAHPGEALGVHLHGDLNSIEHLIAQTAAPDSVKQAALEVYKLLAAAEGEVHHCTPEHIHFHEVGTLDAVADILGCCFLMHALRVERVIASAVNVGKGSVQCAHGILPVPAPASAVLLKGIPIYSAPDITGELCTPTGAALLKYFVDEFSDMPTMRVEKIGYGMGTKDFKAANCVRIMAGTAADADMYEHICELQFHVDDMSAEEIAFGTEELMARGARDVFCTPAYMKKNRLGTLVSVICTPEQKDALLREIFKHFSTLGVREHLCKRYILQREIHSVDSACGVLHRKDAAGYGAQKSKYEYEDLARMARENGCSLAEIKKNINL